LATNPIDFLDEADDAINSCWRSPNALKGIKVDPRTMISSYSVEIEYSMKSLMANDTSTIMALFGHQTKDSTRQEVAAIEWILSL
jgi:hypothetical protein